MCHPGIETKLDYRIFDTRSIMFVGAGMFMYVHEYAHMAHD